jgi:uncharacterized membrane protein YhaH (DUF805 family)
MEYWMFFLFCFIVSLVLGAVDGLMGMGSADGGFSPISTLFTLATLIPSIAVGIRRMHDSDRSGWWILLPIVNLVFFCLPGTVGPNRFGEDPMGSTNADVFS